MLLLLLLLLLHLTAAIVPAAAAEVEHAGSWRSQQVLRRCAAANLGCSNGGFCDTFFDSNSASNGGGGAKVSVGQRLMCSCPIGFSGARCELEGNFKFPELHGNGYLAFELHHFAQSSLTVAMEIRPKLHNGILVYATDSEGVQFLSLTLKDRLLQFSYNNGDGRTSVAHPAALPLHAWHFVSLHRSSRIAWVQVNNSRKAVTITGRKGRLQHRDVVSDLGSPLQLQPVLHIGGIPRSFAGGRVLLHADSDAGFVGCLGNVTLNRQLLDPRRRPFLGDAVGGRNIFDCSAGTCSHHRCHGGAVCRVTRPPSEYRCLCSAASAGHFCETPQLTPITTPQFDGTGHVTVRGGLRRTSKSTTHVTIEFRPRRPDGLLLYAGYSQDTRGDFIAIGLRRGRVTAAFDLGSGTAVIVSGEAVQLHRWCVVQFTRVGRRGRLRVAGQSATAVGHSPGRLVQLTIAQDMRLGGHEDFAQLPATLPLRHNFVGCIHRVSLGSLGEIQLPQQMKAAVNVRQCDNNSCSETAHSCGPGGSCVMDANGRRRCQCRLGFTGTDCRSVHSRKSVGAPEFNRRGYLLFSDQRLLSALSLGNFTLTLRLLLRHEAGGGGSDRTEAALLLLGGPRLGDGDRFLLLTVAQRYLSAHFNDGYGLRSKRNLCYFDARWRRLTVARSGRDISLTVEGLLKESFGDSEWTGKEHFEQLLLGGLDSHTESVNSAQELPGGASGGVAACIRDAKVNGGGFAGRLTVAAASDGRDVRQCAASVRS